MTIGKDEDLAASVIDALTSHICVVDQSGTIVSVNKAWLQFAEANGGDIDRLGPSANYLAICAAADGDSAEVARQVGEGIREVLAGRREYFQAEYPCPAPTEDRWFLCRVSPLRLRNTPGRIEGAVVSHMNITDRRRAEMELARLAATDVLTGVANRRSFLAEAANVFATATAQREALGAVMLDIDRFKEVNDRHGHAAGDAVLSAVAQLCTLSTRRSDLVGRIGGEEFAIILPGSDLGESRTIAERLRAAVARKSVAIASGPLLVTVSLGVAALRPDDRTFETLLARADAALYRAKRRGRNRVVAEDDQLDVVRESFPGLVAS
jgi:diguanylate cyclase (GGDEF)-like protein